MPLPKRLTRAEKAAILRQESFASLALEESNGR